MDIKRLFLAFVLSLIFMFSYSWFFGQNDSASEPKEKKTITLKWY